MRHVPVLLSEVIASLALKKNSNVIDGTLGDGGHSEAILGKTGPEGKLLGIDADPESLLRAKQNLYSFGKRVTFARNNFAHLQQIVTDNSFGPVNGILLDLGWSSPQFSERGRGFSFVGDEPLDMRYNPEFGTGSADGQTAATIIATSSQSDLARIFKQFGEEPLSKEIAAAVASARKNKPIATTKDLVDIILEVYRHKIGTDKEVPWIGGNHPATKVFQALRIATNAELDVLRQALPQALDILSQSGRLAVITFHSLEDRIVKHFFQGAALKKQAILITKKPLVATPEEVEANPRSRSAKLRVIEKL